MKERDKQLADALKKAFPAQPQRERQLLVQIEMRLPARKSRLAMLPLLLNCLAIAGCIVLLLITDWSETAHYIAYITAKYLKEGISLNNLDYNILLLPLLVITIIWLLYNTIEEYLNNRNMDILERAVKQRRQREVAP